MEDRKMEDQKMQDQLLEQKNVWRNIWADIRANEYKCFQISTINVVTWL